MKNLELQIRAYEASDLPWLSSIWHDASQQAHSFLGAPRLQEQRALIETVYLPNSETWVACQTGKPVGFIGLLDNLIGGLFVDPNRQGGGVGRALVAHALKLKGELHLEVYAENEKAVAFYQKLGFEETTRRAEDDDGLPFENIQMRLVP